MNLLQLSSYKRHKKMEKVAYQEWTSSVLSSSKKSTKGNEGVTLLISFILLQCTQRKPAKVIIYICLFFSALQADHSNQS